MGVEMSCPVVETGSQAHVFLAVMAFVFGTVIGSFLNVVVWRVPRGMSLSFPGSHCPRCNHAIAPWENIPVLSWLFLRGRCSACHLPISWRYPAGEAAMGILYLLLFLQAAAAPGGLAPGLLAGRFWLAGTLLALAVIDAEHHLIPDKVVLPGYAAGAALLLLAPAARAAWGRDWQEMRLPGTLVLLAVEILLPLALAALGRLRRLASRSLVLLGWGDVKLILLLLLFLGVRRSFDVLLLGSALGFLHGILRHLLRRAVPGPGRRPSLLRLEVAYGAWLSAAGLLRLLWE